MHHMAAVCGYVKYRFSRSAHSTKESVLSNFEAVPALQGTRPPLRHTGYSAYAWTILFAALNLRLRQRGAIDPIPSGKTLITIRIDEDILAWFREHVNASLGGNYQTMINQELRDYVQQRK